MEYLAPQVHGMNNRFHSEAKLPWSYDYPLANHNATNKSPANREMSLFFAPLPLFRVSSENFPAKGFKILPICTSTILSNYITIYGSIDHRRNIHQQYGNTLFIACVLLNEPTPWLAIIMMEIETPALNYTDSYRVYKTATWVSRYKYRKNNKCKVIHINNRHGAATPYSLRNPEIDIELLLIIFDSTNT